VLLSCNVQGGALSYIYRASTDARLIVSFLPSSLRTHLISTSCFSMNQGMPSVMPGYDDRLAMTGRNSWRPRVNLLGGLRAGRKALTSWLKGGSGRQAKRAEKAADAIVNRIRESKDPNLLDRAIELHREALALRPPGHPDRAGSVAKLGVLLCLRYTQTDNIALMDEAIKLEREALALQPQAHPERAKSCAYLGSLLYARHHQAGNDVLLVEAIKLQREALVLRSPGHRDRADICTDLGTSLRVRYEQTGDVALLNEAIELQYEVLASRFSGHPGRAKTCADLANSLRVRYHHQTGDIALLDKAIELDREALALRPPGHPDRARGCVGLAASLYMQHQQTGDVALLDEKTELEREALALQPPGHPHRANSCANLAASLHVRYEQTGNVVLLDEAIELQREALASIPPGHRHRADVCVNLGASLRVRYQATGNVALLIDAIQLQLEALTLRPPGHPDRADICANLGCLFHLCYRQTGNVVVLDKAIEFERKALALRLPGHPYRTHICANLGVSLNMRYQQTGDVALLDEAIEICMYASEHSSASQVWHPLTQLSELHLLRKLESPYYSVSKAVDYLQRSFQHEVDNIHSFISTICASVALIWDDFSGWTSHTPVPVAAIYAQVIDRLPLVANFVLNTSSRLQSLKATRRVGSDACVAALLARQPDTAVVFLDRAHGVLWTQALHQRDPQIEDAPKDLAIELEDLLRAIAAYTPVDPARLSDRPQDLCHRQNTRIQAILREIRSMPGLARFMLGSPYETLSEAARDHPVVVLVAARGHAFALIMASSSSTGPDILRLDVANDVLQSFTNSVEQGNLRYRGDSPSRDDGSLADPNSPDRAMRPGDHLTRRSPLARLWLSVVKPVLTHLGLTVRFPSK
jgi:tetratricopeptide (TPR) repeat protein